MGPVDPTGISEKIRSKHISTTPGRFGFGLGPGSLRALGWAVGQQTLKFGLWSPIDRYAYHGDNDVPTKVPPGRSALELPPLRGGLDRPGKVSVLGL